VALDIKTGKEVWKTPIEDWHNGYGITSAPLYYDASFTAASLVANSACAVGSPPSTPGPARSSGVGIPCPAR
jgi:hypothetical protein